MKPFAAALIALAAMPFPVHAEVHGRHSHRDRHVVGTMPRRGESGTPITAERDSIRINGVGEVISQPVPLIQKERNFDMRARRELSDPGAPKAAPLP